MEVLEFGQMEWKWFPLMYNFGVKPLWELLVTSRQLLDIIKVIFQTHIRVLKRLDFF